MKKHEVRYVDVPENHTPNYGSTIDTFVMIVFYAYGVIQVGLLIFAGIYCTK